MRTRTLALASALALAAAAPGGNAPLVLAQGKGEMGFSGRVELRQVEAAYRVENNSFKVRVHLVTGMAIDHETRDQAEVDRILQMAQVFASQRARMFVEIEGSAVKAFQISVP